MDNRSIILGNISSISNTLAKKFGKSGNKRYLISKIRYISKNELDDYICHIDPSEMKLDIYQLTCIYMSFIVGQITNNNDLIADDINFMNFLKEWLNNEGNNKPHKEDYLNRIKYEIEYIPKNRHLKYLILSAIILIASIAFVFALNGRYIKVNDDIVFDKWGRSYVYNRY